MGRQRRLECRYSRASLAVVKLLREPAYKDGNGGRTDIGQTAKRQYQLGVRLLWAIRQSGRLDRKDDEDERK